MDNTSNLEADVLQQQKAKISATPVSKEQESEATIYVCSPKLDNGRKKKLSFCCSLWIVGSEFAVNNIR